MILTILVVFLVALAVSNKAVNGLADKANSWVSGWISNFVKSLQNHFGPIPNPFEGIFMNIFEGDGGTAGDHAAVVAEEAQQIVDPLENLADVGLIGLSPDQQAAILEWENSPEVTAFREDPGTALQNAGIF